MYLFFNRKQYELCSIYGCNRPALVHFGDMAYSECFFHYGIGWFLIFLFERLLRYTKRLIVKGGLT